MKGQPCPFPDPHFHAVAPHLRLGELFAQDAHLVLVFAQAVAIPQFGLSFLLHALAYRKQLLLFEALRVLLQVELRKELRISPFLPLILFRVLYAGGGRWRAFPVL